MRVVVVGASSGLGRSIGIGLAQRGAHVALLARRLDKLEAAAREAGSDAVAIQCDVTDEQSGQLAMSQAADKLGGIDAVIYAPAVGPLRRLVDLDAATWREVFDTNVTGASLLTAAAMPHLTESRGTAVFISSVSASLTPPWPGLSAYVVSKAALDKLVEAWRNEHPEVGFTRMVVGECGGGEGDAQSQFTQGWDDQLAAEVMPLWFAREYLSGQLIDIDHLIEAIDGVLRTGPTLRVPTVYLTATPPAGRETPAELPPHPTSAG